MTVPHEDCLAILNAAALTPPRIPAGCNTNSSHFETKAGIPALVINQRGFANTQTDDEQQVNGCSILECMDKTLDDHAAKALLDDVAGEFLERRLMN